MNCARRLSLIRLYAETLELGRIPGPEKQQEYYQTIRKESERLTGLINNILDFSRIEAGRKEYDFRETDFRNWCATRWSLTVTRSSKADSHLKSRLTRKFRRYEWTGNPLRARC